MFERGTSHFDHERFDDMEEKTKANQQRLAGLQHRPQQPRLVIEADIKTDKKTNKRTEGTAAAD